MVSYLSLLAEYILLSTNESCSERGMLSLGDMDDCKKAVKALEIDRVPEEDLSSAWPKGCYQHMEASKDVFFNGDVNGSLRHRKCALICRKG